MDNISAGLTIKLKQMTDKLKKPVEFVMTHGLTVVILFMSVIAILLYKVADRRFNLLEHPVESAIFMISKIVSFIWFGMLAAEMIKRYISDITERLLAVFAVAVFYIMLWYQSDVTSSGVNFMLAICAVTTVIYLMSINKCLAAAPFLCLLAGFADWRAVIIAAPVMLYYTYYFRCIKEKKPKWIFTAVCLVLIAVGSVISEFTHVWRLLPKFSEVFRSEDIFYNITTISKQTLMLSTVLIFMLMTVWKAEKREKLRVYAIVGYYIMLALIFGSQKLYFVGLFAFLSSLLFIVKRNKRTDFRINRETLIHMLCISACAVFVLKLLSSIYSEWNHPDMYFIATPFYVSYQDFGFIQRGLYGTVFRALFGYYMPKETFLTGYLVFFIAFQLVCAWVFAALIKKAPKGFERDMLIIIFSVYIISPGADKFFLEHSNTMFALIGIYLLYRNKPLVWLVPVLAFICMSTHQVFACIVFPLLFIILVYRALIDSQGHTARNTAVLALTLLTVGVSFFYFCFQNPYDIDCTAEQMRNIIYERNCGFLPRDNFNTSLMIEDVFLETDNSHFLYWQSHITPAMRVNLFSYLVLNFLPLVVYIYVFIRSAKTETSKFKKFAYYTAMISIVVAIFPFISECDYGRWFTQYIMILLLGVGLITAFQPADKKWYNGVSRRAIAIVSALMLVLMLIQPTYEQHLHTFVISLM